MIDGYVQNYQRGTRQAITSQFKGVYRDKGLIFVSPDFAQNKHIDIRHPVATSGFHAVDYLQLHPERVMWPGLAISLTVLSINFLGDGLRDAIDPKEY